MDMMNRPDIKKAKIDGRLVDAISYDDYCKNPSMYPNNMTGIIEGEHVLPLRGKNDVRPGVYDYGCLSKFVPPPPEESSEYSTDNIIDFGNVNSMKELIEKNDKVRNVERSILTTKDDIFIPPIRDNDEPLMKAFKEATIAKNFDITKYEDRIGPSATNDLRLYKGGKITIQKAVSLSNALDMEVEIIFRDRAPDVPNPMGREVRAILTSGDNVGGE